MRFCIETLDHIVLNTSETSRSVGLYTHAANYLFAPQAGSSELYPLWAGNICKDDYPSERPPGFTNFDLFHLRLLFLSINRFYLVLLSRTCLLRLRIGTIALLALMTHFGAVQVRY